MKCARVCEWNVSVVCRCVCEKGDTETSHSTPRASLEWSPPSPSSRSRLETPRPHGRTTSIMSPSFPRSGRATRSWPFPLVPLLVVIPTILTIPMLILRSTVQKVRVSHLNVLHPTRCLAKIAVLDVRSALSLFMGCFVSHARTSPK